MARARNIKPGFFLNETLGELPPLTRLLFIGLWTIADKEGRLADRPKRIHASTLPYDQVNVEPMLNQLQSNGFIIRYSVKELAYIQIVNWKKHQSPHYKESDSEIPEYNEVEHKLIQCCVNVESSMDVKNDSLPSDSLIPDSLIPDSGFSDSLIPDLKDRKSALPRKTRRTEKINGVETSAVWKSYSDAYAIRYAVNPVRNAKVNSQIKQLVERLGLEDSIHVAAFYVTHSNSYYIQRAHAVDCLLRDAEKLRTEWITGIRITSSGARQADRTQQNRNVLNKLLQENANGKL